MLPDNDLISYANQLMPISRSGLSWIWVCKLPINWRQTCPNILHIQVPYSIQVYYIHHFPWCHHHFIPTEIHMFVCKLLGKSRRNLPIIASGGAARPCQQAQRERGTARRCLFIDPSLGPGHGAGWRGRSP